MKKIKISGGHTNDTFKVIKNKKTFFLKELNHDSFNHRINYDLLKKLDFVPQIVEKDDKHILSNYIESKPINNSKSFLEQSANILKIVHSSNLKFPNNNLLKRINAYYKMVKTKHKNSEIIEKNLQLVKKLISNFKMDSPSHNDPWINNFILEKKTNKLYLVDWEYATMNDKHFDLAYFIDGSYLNKEEEEIFLNKYKDYEKCKLEEAKLIVNFLTLLWLYRFDKMPFSDEKVINNITKAVICCNSD